MKRWQYEPQLAASKRDWTPELLARIGWFEDGLSEQDLHCRLYDRRWVTPTHHLRPEGGVVLCTTGAFSPFHTGHLRMLEIARAEVEARGFTVAGALVQPDHDGYVSTKRGGTCACPAAERIHLAQIALMDHPWVQVDPWAALYQDRALNYTTILSRTTRYLGPRYQVVYVFGSDNAGFAEAFLPHQCVCVGRPGHGTANPQALPLSSTQVRQPLTQWPLPTEDSPYLVRDDVDWATRQWAADPLARAQFGCSLKAALFNALGTYPVTLVPALQRRHAERLDPHVNLDPVTGGPHWVSRVFEPMTLQAKPVRHTSSDLSTIPPGRIALVDDDISSGSTVAYVKAYAPQVDWWATWSLVRSQHDGPYHDVVDARDFLFGGRLGGLVTTDGYRVPYILPWVNLWSRACIPPPKQAAFTRAVCEANVELFRQVTVLVGQTDNAALWHRLGFADSQPMLEVSQALLSWTKHW